MIEVSLSMIEVSGAQTIRSVGRVPHLMTIAKEPLHGAGIAKRMKKMERDRKSWDWLSSAVQLLIGSA